MKIAFGKGIKMKVKTMIMGDLDTNTYVVYDEKSFEAVLIDPAAEPERIVEITARLGLIIKGILITHGHFDHIGAVDYLKSHFNCPVYASQEEAELMQESIQNLSAYFISRKIVASASHVLNHDEELVITDQLKFRCIIVPGHSPASVCYYIKDEKLLFSGDTLMEGSIGRTDYYSGASQDLIDYIKERLMNLPKETVIYAGHGKTTTIAHEYKHNHYLGKNLWL